MIATAIAPRLPIRRCSVTPHAVRRFRERVMTWVTARQAKELIRAAINEAKQPSKEVMRRAGKGRQKHDFTIGGIVYWYHPESGAFFVTQVTGVGTYRVTTCWKV